MLAAPSALSPPSLHQLRASGGGNLESLIGFVPTRARGGLADLSNRSRARLVASPAEWGTNKGLHVKEWCFPTHAETHAASVFEVLELSHLVATPPLRAGNEQQTRIVNRALTDYYRCPDRFANFVLAGDLSEDSGYFRFGKEAICYGRTALGFRSRLPANGLYDALGDVALSKSELRLSFDPSQVVDNLRCERYLTHLTNGRRDITTNAFLRSAYYLIRPALPIAVRKHLQRLHVRGWDQLPFPGWPVDRTVEQILERLLALSIRACGGERIPFIWFWPDGLPSCAMITHDVETSAGRDFCSKLMDIDDSFGIKTSFQVVPEKRYTVSQHFLESIRNLGFEINIHDLNHDGQLFDDRQEFRARAQRINQYAEEYGARGFRSAVLYRNLAWYDELNVSYDMSVPNVGHLDLQHGGCCTVMPYFIGRILELPLTTTQDYSLFQILGQYSIDLWKEQAELIMARNGLVSFIVHPDYIKRGRARQTYLALLEYLTQLRSEGKIWITLPADVDRWWRERSQMQVVWDGGQWRIEGKGKERARLAYAKLAGDSVVYELS